MIDEKKPEYVLEEERPFSQSLLWQLQRQYFEQRGFSAWGLGEVPYFITSNAVIASQYAETVFSLYQDLQEKEAANNDPIYIAELGAGTGRLAFLILKKLAELCTLGDINFSSFKYILTDFTQVNLDFWHSHPGFQSFFEDGVLDIAVYDVTKPGDLYLQLAGKKIGAGDLSKPIVTIANYLFDTVPQDLFYFDNGTINDCTVSLSLDRDPETMKTPEILKELRYTHHYHPVTEDHYHDHLLDGLLKFYAGLFSDGYILFPSTGLVCLQSLRQLSSGGLLLLSADKGSQYIDAVLMNKPPEPVLHGSFSLSVNYHAIKMFCEENGGIAFFPKHTYQHINTCCMLFANDADSYRQLRLTCYRLFQGYGADDMFAMHLHQRTTFAQMNIETVLSYLRLNCYDSHYLLALIPALKTLAPDLSADQRIQLKASVMKAWDQYFPVGEPADFAAGLGSLFYELDDFETAIIFFKESIRIYGNDTGTVYNMAMCYAELGEEATAITLLQRVITADPANTGAATALDALKAGKQPV